MDNTYSKGLPAGDYNSLLIAMSSTSVHSSKTSSIPLADFWHPDRNNDLKLSLFKAINITEGQYKEATKAFEYPTKAYQRNFEGPTIQYSGPSMSDMMIESNQIKVTIEAKYTEYYKDSCPYSPLIGQWMNEHSKNDNRKSILNCWRRYIGLKPYLSDDEIEKDNDFPYQFLHRSASACFNADSKKKVLLYQLFYDDKTKDSLASFESNLSMWANRLGLREKGVQFVIAEVQVDTKNSSALSSKKKGELFLKMINEPQYQFGMISFKDGYSLEIIK